MRELPGGYTVRFRHLRRYSTMGARRPPLLESLSAGRDGEHLMTMREIRHHGLEPLPRGGATSALILGPRGNALVEYTARCSPNDNYCKAIGRQIALGRALKQLADLTVR